MSIDFNTECTLSLTVEGYLALRTPQGRTLSIPPTAEGCKLIVKILREAKALTRDTQPTGYCRNYPTQHVVDKWLRANREKQTEQLESEVGVSISSLDIRL